MKCTKQYLHILKTFTVEIVKKEKIEHSVFFFIIIFVKVRKELSRLSTRELEDRLGLSATKV